MAVYLAAGLAVLFYAVNVPICAAFSLTLGAENRLMVGMGVFTARAKHQRSLALPQHKQPSGKKKPLSADDLLRLGLRVLKHVKVEAGRVDLTLGTGDAASTALICGASRALAQAVDHRHRLRVRIEPAFAQPRLNVEANLLLSVTAYHLLSAAFYILTRRVLEIGKASH